MEAWEHAYLRHLTPPNWRLKAGLIVERVQRRLGCVLSHDEAEHLLDSCMAPDRLQVRAIAIEAKIPLRRRWGRLWP